jgi:hypothetical protein
VVPADHRRLNGAIWRFQDIHQSLQALIGIYDRYRELEGQDPQTLASILTWMEDQMQELLTSTRHGQIAVEAGIRCGENYLIKQ